MVNSGALETATGQALGFSDGLVRIGDVRELNPRFIEEVGPQTTDIKEEKETKEGKKGKKDGKEGNKAGKDAQNNSPGSEDKKGNAPKAKYFIKDVAISGAKTSALIALETLETDITSVGEADKAEQGRVWDASSLCGNERACAGTSARPCVPH